MHKKPFYGYWVLACCFIFTLVVECNVVVFSLFIKPLQAALGWSQTLILGGSTIFIVASALIAPVCGQLAERLGARIMVTAGALATGAGLFLLSRVGNIAEFYIGYALIGLGYTAAGAVTLTYVVSNWFESRRGVAVGTMSMGVGIASIIFAPLVAVYLLPNLGWRASYSTLGLIQVVIIAPLSVLVLRTRPGDMGLQAYGASHDAAETAQGQVGPVLANSADEGLSLQAAARTAAFWLIGISLVLNHTHLGVLQIIYPHLMEIGFSPQMAASAIGLTGSFATLGLFFFGWFCDKTGAPTATAIGMGLTTVAIVMFMAIGPHSPPALLWFSVAILGFGTGSWMPTMSMLTSATFGMASYGPIFGIMMIFASVGAAAGPLIAGYVHDVTLSYFWAFCIMAVMIALGIPAILFVKRPSSDNTARQRMGMSVKC